MKEIPGKPEQVHQISRKNPSFNKGQATGQSEAFGKILSEQLNPAPGTEAASISEGLPELESTYTAATLSLTDRGSKLSEKISTSLDLLDTYASILSDPEKTLKQAHKLLEDLSEQTDRLLKEIDQSPKTDQSLKKIITQLSAMVQVEQIKIIRGDYTDLP